MELKGKVALVTGSSSGIGKAIAIALAHEGCNVVVNSRSSIDKGEEVVKEIKSKGESAIYVQGNLSKESDTRKLFETIVKKFATVDILINNAGDARGGKFDDIELWKYQFESILLSQVMATGEFLKIKSKSSRKIVNISSIYGSDLGGKENYVAYSAFKAGINSMTVNLAKNLKGKILVNAIAPGWTWTPAWGDDRAAEEKDIKGKLPINRFVESEEIADMTLSILKNDALTGQIITVDGGASLKEFIL